jgi:hypothetical protein
MRTPDIETNNALPALYLVPYQCCGYVTFWKVSRPRSADPYLWLTYPDPAIFVSGLQDANKNKFSKFFCLLLVEGTFTSIFTDKVIKKSQNSRHQGSSYYFCLMMGRPVYESGPVPVTLTNGSGRPKNLWILRIRIRNTESIFSFSTAITTCLSIC